MARKTKKKTARKRSTAARTGRPKTTGAGAPMVVRMHDPQIKAIDGWIGDSDITRPEAIRQLVTWALAHTKPKEPAETPVHAMQKKRERELHRS